MRISASGLVSTIAVAIDQILRLAPSIRPPIEPVVSSTKATSTAGFAVAAVGVRKGRLASVAKASVRVTMRGIVVLLQCVVPWKQVPKPSRFPEVEIAAGRLPFCGLRAPKMKGGNRMCVGAESARLGRHGIARPPNPPRAAAGPPPVRDGAGDRPRHGAAVALARLCLCQRIAAALRPSSRSSGAERARRDLDRRDQVVAGGFAGGPEMARLPRPLRSAVLRLHGGPAVRNLPRRHRP